MESCEAAACFACGAEGAAVPLFQTAQRRLRGCRSCGAQWLEGGQAGDEPYDYGTDQEDRADPYLLGRARRFAKLLAARGGNGGGRRLFDAGCGAGEFLTLASKHGWDAEGLEVAAAAAAVARRRSGCPVYCGRLQELVASGEVERGAYDAVTLWGVIEHLSDPFAVVQACAVLLRPGGALLLETPNPEGLFRRTALGVARHAAWDVPLRETLGARHVCWVSARACDAMLRRAGFASVWCRGSRNSTRVLLDRFRDVGRLVRPLCYLGAALGNGIAAPLGMPNQLVAVAVKGYA